MPGILIDRADCLGSADTSAPTGDPVSDSVAAGPDSSNAAPMSADAAAELVAARTELAAARARLHDTERLATIGTIAAVIAHEFNNLLTPIVSYSQFALTSASGDKPDMELIRKALGKTHQAGSKAGEMCSSMLRLARGESCFGEVPVRRLVDEVLLVMARDPQKDGLALRVQIPPDLCVFGDAVQLEQVLLNLLINARQAMIGRGGSLWIKAARTDSAGELRLQVIDTGPGIPAPLLGRIFDPFFTTKAATRPGERGGTGLGLAICKEIVERHGGRLEVQSKIGKGTTFSIYLPEAAQPARTAA
jgi:signal transduction histidine kinase